MLGKVRAASSLTTVLEKLQLQMSRGKLTQSFFGWLQLKFVGLFVQVAIPAVVQSIVFEWVLDFSREKSVLPKAGVFSGYQAEHVKLVQQLLCVEIVPRVVKLKAHRVERLQCLIVFIYSFQGLHARYLPLFVWICLAPVLSDDIILFFLSPCESLL